jgi:hypothetical protein
MYLPAGMLVGRVPVSVAIHWSPVDLCSPICTEMPGAEENEAETPTLKVTWSHRVRVRGDPALPFVGAVRVVVTERRVVVGGRLVVTRHPTVDPEGAT